MKTNVSQIQLHIILKIHTKTIDDYFETYYSVKLVYMNSIQILKIVQWNQNYTRASVYFTLTVLRSPCECFNPRDLRFYALSQDMTMFAYVSATHCTVTV